MIQPCNDSCASTQPLALLPFSHHHITSSTNSRIIVSRASDLLGPFIFYRLPLHATENLQKKTPMHTVTPEASTLTDKENPRYFNAHSIQNTTARHLQRKLQDSGPAYNIALVLLQIPPAFESKVRSSICISSCLVEGMHSLPIMIANGYVATSTAVFEHFSVYLFTPSRHFRKGTIPFLVEAVDHFTESVDCLLFRQTFAPINEDDVVLNTLDQVFPI